MKKQDIGNNIKSLLLMEVSWQMWKTNKNTIRKKTILSIISQLCAAKGIKCTRQDMAGMIADSKSYQVDSDNNVSFVNPYFMAYFLAKRLYLSLRKAKMKSIFKLLNTRYYDNDTLYFLSMLDQDTHSIHKPLQTILKNEYIENVTENAIHIYTTTAQMKHGFQTRQPEGFLNITNYNLTQNLDFSLELQNNNNLNDTNRAKYFFDQGLQLLKENRNFEAMAPLFAAKALDPRCMKAANNLAIVFKNLGSLSIARQMVESVLLAEPENYRAKQHMKCLDFFENKLLTDGKTQKI